MKVGVLGLGKLGLPVAVTLAHAGHDVIGWDVSAERLSDIGDRKVPEAAHEPMLEDYLREHPLTIGRDFSKHRPQVILVCVQTPHEPRLDGTVPPRKPFKDFDYAWLSTALSTVCARIRSHNASLQGNEVWDPLVVTVSTCLPGTFDREFRYLFEGNPSKAPQFPGVPPLSHPIRFAYHPLFVAMGSVIPDFSNPEFLLCGTDRDYVPRELLSLYDPVFGDDRPTHWRVMSIMSAELTKVAYNVFIGYKLMFVNGLAMLSDRVGANVDDIVGTLKLADNRLISRAYMDPGMGDGGACFPAGELVMTVDGPRVIEEIEPGDLVLTAHGSFERVARRWERHYEGDVVTVTVEGMPPVRATADHGFFASRDGRPYKPDGRRRSDLLIGDYLSPLREVAAGNLDPELHYLAWPVPAASWPPVPPEQASWSEYCELAGWYLSEGSIEQRVHPVTENPRGGRISFSLHAHERDVAARLAELLAELDPPRSKGRGAGSTAVISAKGAQGLLLRYGAAALAKRLVDDFGSGAADKRLPAWVVYGSQETMALVLRGLILGDGHNGSSGIAFATISQNLAYGVLVMLERLGVGANLRRIEPRTGRDGVRHRTAYEVRVRNATDVDQLAGLLGIEPQRTIQEKRYERQPVVDDNRMRKVLSVARERFQGTVYNLWVDHPSHSYVTSAGLVANCHPRDQIALAWLADQYDIPSDSFHTVIEARDLHAQWLAGEWARVTTLHGLHPMIQLGTAYKPDTTLQDGSHALLLAHYAKPKRVIDPEPLAPTPLGELPVASYFLATPHYHFLEAINAGALPEGSLLFDPWGVASAPPGVKVYCPGRRSGSS